MYLMGVLGRLHERGNCCSLVRAASVHGGACERSAALVRGARLHRCDRSLPVAVCVAEQSAARMAAPEGDDARQCVRGRASRELLACSGHEPLVCHDPPARPSVSTRRRQAAVGIRSCTSPCRGTRGRSHRMVAQRLVPPYELEHGGSAGRAAVRPRCRPRMAARPTARSGTGGHDEAAPPAAATAAVEHVILRARRGSWQQLVLRRAPGPLNVSGAVWLGRDEATSAGRHVGHHADDGWRSVLAFVVDLDPPVAEPCLETVGSRRARFATWPALDAPASRRGRPRTWPACDFVRNRDVSAWHARSASASR
jgi:hypothetical protein